MKIISVDLLALQKDRAGTRPIICRINTDEGFYGLGEAAVGIGCGARGAFELLKDFAPMIIGMDPMQNEVIWEKIFKQSFWGQGNGAILMAALSAIDVALWDIKGKACNLPVYAKRVLKKPPARSFGASSAAQTEPPAHSDWSQH